MTKVCRDQLDQGDPTVNKEQRVPRDKSDKKVLARRESKVPKDHKVQRERLALEDQQDPWDKEVKKGEPEVRVKVVKKVL